jgi:chemotaxis protein methyltransferase CheR
MEWEHRTRVRNQAFTLLRDLISERIGMYFDETNMDLMIDKISTLMTERGIDSPIDYYYLLKYDSNAENEWSNLLNIISVRETFFWREIDQVRALVDVVVPKLAKTLAGPLRIWSAACASGEEPITIAMALDQAGWLRRIPIEIFASDASAAAICAATEGVYRERAFRNLPSELRDHYFSPVPGGWKINAGIHKRIQWRIANLTNSSNIEGLAHAQVIFCRNVFIYFSEAAILKTVKLFADCMPQPGYLFLGAAESLLKFTTDFELREIGGAFAYVKDARGE